MSDSFSFSDCLMHHGIKGMKWGVRRYRNEDGTLTPAGKERYGTIENLEAAQKKKKKIAKTAVTAATYGAWGYFVLSGKYYNLMEKLSSKLYKASVKRGRSHASKIRLSDMTMDDLSKLDLY